MDATRRGGDGDGRLLPGGGGGSIRRNKYQPAVSRPGGGSGRFGDSPGLHVRWPSPRGQAVACEVEAGRRGQRGSHFAGRAPHPATAVAAERVELQGAFRAHAPTWTASSSWRSPGLERLEGGAQTVRLEVRLDGRDEVGGVRRGDGGHSVHGGRCWIERAASRGRAGSHDWREQSVVEFFASTVVGGSAGFDQSRR